MISVRFSDNRYQFIGAKYFLSSLGSIFGVVFVFV